MNKTKIEKLRLSYQIQLEPGNSYPVVSNSWYFELFFDSPEIVGFKVMLKFFKFAVCNPCQSSPSLTILVP